MQTVRRLTPAGRMFVVLLIAGMAFVALAVLILVPSPYGVAP
jgi:hypothetical protein